MGAFSVMRVFLPPHPGPVTAARFFEANVATSSSVGLICAIPAWYLSSYLFGKIVGRRINLPVPTILGPRGGRGEPSRGGHRGGHPAAAHAPDLPQRGWAPGQGPGPCPRDGAGEHRCHYCAISVRPRSP
ncbi:hypothetical protein QJS66_10165 [Kocuria rhizophila]|nr:hypothetical protein QJS66_10165 [Kocuria rhizophila]